MLRRPAVAGQFYPASQVDLIQMLHLYVDPRLPKEDAIGVVSPHAGYIYSGPVAGAVFARIKPRTVYIVMGPNHTGLGRPFSIMTEGSWQTPLGNVPIHEELAQAIKRSSNYLEDNFSAHQFEHSVEVQLPFIQYIDPEACIVPMVLSEGTIAIYQDIAQAIVSALTELNLKAVIVASSDMTHYESQESTQRKDNIAIEAILRLDESELLRRIDEFKISMCGFVPAVVMLIAVKMLGATGAELASYRTSGDTTGDYTSVVGYAGILVKGQLLHPLVRLAKEAVETYVREGKVISPPRTLAPEMIGQAGVFVSLHRNGELRGCIGTIEPVQENIAAEVIANAINAATRDPRFPAVSVEELPELEYSVDVLSPSEKVANLNELDPKKFGVIVERGYRRGLLLPDLEGVDTVEKQLDICRRKAGILPGEPVNIYRFTVTRYH